MSVIGRRAEGVARHSRRRPARDAGIETASKRHQNENGRRGARFFSLRRLVRGGATGPREARANAHMFG
ncbi:Ser/Thr protein phosphatase [Burkholderia pseudomallei]|nr:Ser/Thr protein phosphatase [Burkholderia pseudomallei]